MFNIILTSYIRLLYIAPDKVLFFQPKNINIFLFLHENICCGTYDKALLLSTHNICFHTEIRKNIFLLLPLFWSCAVFNLAETLQMSLNANVIQKHKSDLFEEFELRQMHVDSNFCMLKIT